MRKSGYWLLRAILRCCGKPVRLPAARTESTGINVALDFQNPLYESGIGCQHTYAPSRHVVALAHGVELYATLLGAGDAEDTDGVFVQDEAVGVVVHDDDVLAAGKVYQLPV